MKYLVLFVLPLLLIGCHAGSGVDPSEATSHLHRISGEANTIRSLAQHVSPEDTAQSIDEHAVTIVDLTGDVQSSVDRLGKENASLRAENESLRGISMTDWITVGLITGLIVFLAIKFTALFWYAVPVPAIGLCLKWFIAGIMNNLALIIVVFGLVVLIFALWFVWSAFKGNVNAIQQWKKVLPQALRQEIFGDVGETGLAGRTQPEHTQKLIKKIKDN